MDGDTHSAQLEPLDGLTAAEVRVLGSLVEKETTVPDSYPLTLNSLRTACNQSTSRDPVVDYGDREVEQALASLRSRGLTRTVHSTSNRAVKYRHVLPEVAGLDAGETALLAVLMLRGAQTVGELKSRTARQHDFASTDEVAGVLASLAARAAPLVRRLERRPGQKDARWVHLLASPEPDEADTDPVNVAVTAADPAEPRDVSRDDDPYAAATAEFYDLVGTAHWDRTGLELLELLDGVDASVGPLVDIGVGTGVGLTYLTAAAPDADIYAIEPSKAMRTALHTRLALDDRLRATVTIDPRPLASADLPPVASALTMTAVLGHLTDDERARVWRYVAEQMPVGAPAVIELLPPFRPDVFPLVRYREVSVGSLTYEGWQSGEPSGDRDMTWTMIYRVRRGDRQIAEHSVRSTWRCTSPDDLRAEVEPFGLTVDHAESFVVLHR